MLNAMFVRTSLLAAISVASLAYAAEPRVNVGGTAPDLNALVLRVIDQMPEGGTYAANAEANKALASAVGLDATGLSFEPAKARPSYCSGATYLVFIGVVQQLLAQGRLSLDDETRAALTIHGQRDGEGIWGRWNANGPGTARLFAELKLGQNFTDWSKAKPGDFMKVWWNDEVGKLEHGHSVVLLGRQVLDGVEYVNFWSSNQPAGYGHKLIPRSKIVWAVFSRLENPGNLARLKSIPPSDAYLASLLGARSSQEEVKAKCGVE
jgi:hypothetical protein